MQNRFYVTRDWIVVFTKDDWISVQHNAVQNELSTDQVGCVSDLPSQPLHSTVRTVHKYVFQQQNAL